MTIAFLISSRAAGFAWTGAAEAGATWPLANGPWSAARTIAAATARPASVKRERAVRISGILRAYADARAPCGQAGISRYNPRHGRQPESLVRRCPERVLPRGEIRGGGLLRPGGSRAAPDRPVPEPEHRRRPARRVDSPRIEPPGRHRLLAVLGRLLRLLDGRR